MDWPAKKEGKKKCDKKKIIRRRQNGTTHQGEKSELETEEGSASASKERHREDLQKEIPHSTKSINRKKQTRGEKKAGYMPIREGGKGL